MSMAPTTFEMDGLLTEEDIKNRYTVVFQCFNDYKWTIHENWLPGEHHVYKPCVGCGEKNYDMTSIKSLRTYRPTEDAKRRPSKANKANKKTAS